MFVAPISAPTLMPSFLMMGEEMKRAVLKYSWPTASPVPLGNLSVLLSIPFRDEQTSELHRQSFAATVEQSEDTINVSVELLNDWVRLERFEAD